MGTDWSINRTWQLQKLLRSYNKRRRLYLWELFWQWRSFQIQVSFVVFIWLQLYSCKFSSNEWSLHGQTFKYYGQTTVAKGLQVMHIGTYDGTSTRAQYWELQYDDTFTISESETVFDNWYVPYIWFYWIKNKIKIKLFFIPYKLYELFFFILW